MNDLPDKVKDWIGNPVVVVENVLTADAGLWQNYCAAVEDANPLYWGGPEASELTDGAIAPPAMLPSWLVEHEWCPNPSKPKLRTMELHFMLKDALDIPYGVVTEVELEFHQPVRAGDKLHAEQILKEISEEYETRLGTGRRWTIVVNYYHEDGNLAGRQQLGFVAYRKDKT